MRERVERCILKILESSSEALV